MTFRTINNLRYTGWNNQLRSHRDRAEIQEEERGQIRFCPKKQKKLEKLKEQMDRFWTILMHKMMKIRNLNLLK